MALDACRDCASVELAPPNPALLEELDKASHRSYMPGFANGEPGAAGQSTDYGGYLQTHELSALVLEYDAANKRALVEQRNRFFAGDTLEVLSPGDIGRKAQYFIH